MFYNFYHYICIVKRKNKMNNIEKVINSIAKPNFPFKPQREFYEEIAINQKRFWQIIRNEVQPNLDEIERIAKVLNVAPKDLINLY